VRLTTVACILDTGQHCVITDNEDRRKKITIAIKPVVPNRRDSVDNITDIRNVVQGIRLSPTLQVSANAVCIC